jgi:trans-aconitate 2-methyltransferase
MAHEWDPKQYERFEKERNQPFFDLIQLIHPLAHHPRILDLGCGNGALTKIVHEKFQASYTLGIDTSKEMLAKAQLLQDSHLVFKEQDIRSFTSHEPFNCIISNAALQWVPNHHVLLKQMMKLLAPEGQLAIQMPANQSYPTHVIANELATEEPFKRVLKQHGPRMNYLLSMEEYAELLDKLGFESQIVRLQLYAHFLESTASVIEWVKGSLLTYYKSYLDAHLYAEFFKEYQKRLIERLGWSEPFFFPMKRLFLWGQLAEH